MKRPVVLAATLFGLAAVIAGCSGDPQPAPTTSRPTTRPSQSTVAPAVEGGVELQQYLAKPCALLTADQRAAEGGIRQTFEGGDPDRGVCIWESATVRDTVFTYVQGDPLADVYRHRNDQYHTYFDPFTISGLPAVRTWAVAPPEANACDVYVGAGHGQGLRVESSKVSTQLDVKLDWCAHATALAEAMVATAQG